MRGASPPLLDLDGKFHVVGGAGGLRRDHHTIRTSRRVDLLWRRRFPLGRAATTTGEGQSKTHQKKQERGAKAFAWREEHEGASEKAERGAEICRSGGPALGHWK